MANRQKRTHVSRETCCERRQGRKMYAVFYLLHLPRTLCAPNRDRSARGAGRRRCTRSGRFCTKSRDEMSFPTVLPTKPSILLRSLQYRSGVFESNQNCAKYGNRQGVARRGFLCRNGSAACEIACAQPSPSVAGVNDGVNDMQTRAASAEAARVRS